MTITADQYKEAARKAYAAGDVATARSLLARATASTSQRPSPGQSPEEWKAERIAAAKDGTIDAVQSPGSIEMDQSARVAMNDPGALTTAMLSAGQGLTMGFSDEMAAGLVAPFSSATYDELLQRARRGIEGGKDARPVTAAVSEIGGAILPAIATAGASLPANAGLAAKAGVGALTGAAQGAAYGFGTGEGGLDERLANAGRGGVVGALGGAAAPGMVAGARAVGNVVANPVRSALNIGSDVQASAYIKKLMERSGMSLDDIKASLQSAQDDGQAMFGIADALGQTGQRALSGVTRQPGPGRQVVADTLMGRQGGQANRLGTFITDGLDAPDTAKMTEALGKAERRVAGNLNYGAARTQAQPVDVRGALQVIDDRLGPMSGSGVAGDGIDGQFARFRSRLATPAGSDPNLQLSDFNRVLGVKQDIDDAIGAAVRAGRNNEARELGRLKATLDDSLATSSAPYAAARDEYAAASRAIEAVDAGKRAAPSTARIEDVATAYGRLAPAEQAGFRAGYADPTMARIDGAAVGANKARPLTSEKSVADFGLMAKDPAKLQRQIGRENTMFETTAQALGGSRTADNLADNADANGQLSSLMVNLLTGNLRTAGRQALDKMVNAGTGSNEATRDVMARLLLSGDIEKAVTPAIRKQLQAGKVDDAIAAIMRGALISSAQ